MRTLSASAQLLGIATLTLSAVTACSSSSAVPPTLGAASLPPATAHVGFGRQLLHKGAKRAQPLLYAAGFAADAVFVYDQSEKSPGEPLYKITDGIGDPNGLATDSSGDLYVANELTNTVTIYVPGSTSPIATISDGVNAPFAVAVDSNDNVFVANNPTGGSTGSYINEYPSGATSPSNTWYPPQSHATITGLAIMPTASSEILEATFYVFDSGGNPHGDLMQCYLGNPYCSNDGYSFGETGDLAIKSTQPLEILVADKTVPGIWNLTASSTKLTKTKRYTPWFMAFTPNRKDLFISNGESAVGEYKYPNLKKATKVFLGSGGSEGPLMTGVAVTPSGTF